MKRRSRAHTTPDDRGKSARRKFGLQQATSANWEAAPRNTTAWPCRGSIGKRFSRSISASLRSVRSFCSAAQSGSTDVYAALDSTLATLEAALVGMSVPPSEVGQHQLLDRRNAIGPVRAGAGVRRRPARTRAKSPHDVRRRDGCCPLSQRRRKPDSHHDNRQQSRGRHHGPVGPRAVHAANRDRADSGREDRHRGNCPDTE